MSPENVAAHFARIKPLSQKFDITKPWQVFKLDECGFSIRGMALGRRVKRLVQRSSRASTRTLKWQRTADHVTMMAIVNAVGQKYTPVFVLLGKRARFRRRARGAIETPADYLPSPSYT